MSNTGGHFGEKVFYNQAWHLLVAELADCYALIC